MIGRSDRKGCVNLKLKARDAADEMRDALRLFAGRSPGWLRLA